ncbi:MAG: protein-tyrosine phosphatase [bacterium]|nr:MAG: protein-tyrosine phosphatase [bacterium]
MSSLPAILFVCIENSCRSQLAEAFAKIYGKGVIQAYSAGSRPSGKVNPKAIESMKELSYDLTEHSSKSLTEIPTFEYEFAITMGCGDECPMIQAKNKEDWQIPDPKNMSQEEFRVIRDSIENKVKSLIAKINSLD